MIKKRFIIDDDGIVTDMVDLSMYIDNDDCCEKLNELNYENEQLKQQLKDCTAKAKEEIRKQKEENAIRWANIGR